MPHQLSKKFVKIFLTGFYFFEAIILVAITLATIYAMFNDFINVFLHGVIRLKDILLMFIYLEVLAMIQQFVTNGKIPVRYPIYIAMMAIARYITLGMKEITAEDVIWLSSAAFILAATTVMIRAGHFYWPYKPLRKDDDSA